MKILLSCLVALALFFPFQAAAQCNGDSSLCAKRYDEVCYVTTHNAFNYQGAFFFPNQNYPVATQLNDGVRALMLDVYWYNNQPTVYHSSNFLGNEPLIDLLNDIKTFLDQHPNEVVTIIFESYITSAQTEAVFQQAGLLPYCHVQNIAQPWPTLGAMIQANTRLVVMTDANDTQGHPWLHHVWDHAVETHFTAYSRADFSCDFNRGDSANALFILNHFITQDPLGYGLPDSAAAINARTYLQSRAMGCWVATGKLPNFLTVDFYDQGDVFEVANAVNTGLVHADAPVPMQQRALRVYPQPSIGLFSLKIPESVKGRLEIQVWDGLGRLVYSERRAASSVMSIELPGVLPGGRYQLQIIGKGFQGQAPLSVVR
jgi:hypothetical protein